MILSAVCRLSEIVEMVALAAANKRGQAVPAWLRRSNRRVHSPKRRRSVYPVLWRAWVPRLSVWLRIERCSIDDRLTVHKFTKGSKLHRGVEPARRKKR
jgi:hypothetical protein